jgi:hypothetical protein
METPLPVRPKIAKAYLATVEALEGCDSFSFLDKTSAVAELLGVTNAEKEAARAMRTSAGEDVLVHCEKVPVGNEKTIAETPSVKRKASESSEENNEAAADGQASDSDAKAAATKKVKKPEAKLLNNGCMSDYRCEEKVTIISNPRTLPWDDTKYACNSCGTGLQKACQFFGFFGRTGKSATAGDAKHVAFLASVLKGRFDHFAAHAADIKKLKEIAPAKIEQKLKLMHEKLDA